MDIPICNFEKTRVRCRWTHCTIMSYIGRLWMLSVAKGVQYSVIMKQSIPRIIHKILTIAAPWCRVYNLRDQHLFHVMSQPMHCCIQYIPRNMHTVCALLCFVVVIHWLIFQYPSGLLHWHCGNLTIAPVPAKQPWWIWINTSCEFIMNDCITTTK